MKIAMFGHKQFSSREGGVERVVTELSTRMAALGHTVICYDRSDGHVKNGNLPNGIIVHSVWTLPGKGLAAVTASLSAAICCAVSDAEVVHVHGEGPAFWCFLPKLAGKRVVVTIHGLDWQREKWKNSPGRRFIRWGEAMAVRFADEIIVLTSSMQHYFSSVYGRETLWIPNGAECPVPKPAERIRMQFGLEKDSYILFLGRLVPEKGIHTLIEAFRRVKTDKRLVIAGGSSDMDGYVTRLEKMAARDDRIFFPGFVQGQILEELYSNAYVYILPSELEGMPLSLLEAMGYGNCCLTSDIPACIEVLADAGLSFPVGNAEKLAQMLQQLCDHPEIVSVYREKAGVFASGFCSWDDVVQKTLEGYR